MELSDPQTIAFLIDAQMPRRRPPSPLRASPLSSAASPIRSMRPLRCQCGICARCAENARWEKIFNEKFADPEYYSTSRSRFSSALSEIAKTRS
jgi:hypothetical protein